MQQQIDVHPTHHAFHRAQQRGIGEEDLDLIAAFADRELRASGGCEYWALSSEGTYALRAEGFSRQHIDRVRRFAIIIDPEHGSIVTVFPATQKWRRQPKRDRGRQCRRTSER